MIKSGRIALLCAALFAGTSVSAHPWAEVGDRQLKEDLELLRDVGIISGPVTSWPIPWSGIARDMEAVDGVAVSPFVRFAILRIKARMDASLAAGTRYEASLNAATEPGVVRDFGSAAREDAEAQVRVSHEFDGVSLTYGIGWRRNQQGKDLHADNLQASAKLGNWALYAGTVETWWGPGTESALLFSNSARPFPKIGIKRLSPEPFTWPVLKWLGPWRFDFFVGILDEQREYSNQAVSGIRFTFQPIDHLEIGVQRALQLCGKGRPCSLNTWKNAFIGLGNADNTGTINEPGNQLAGFDFRYSRVLGPVAANFYFEAIAEDEDNFLIEQFARSWGASASGGFGESGARWRAGVEYTDTLGSKILGGQKYIGSVYNQFIYTDGFTYRRKPIGASLDGDSKIFSVSGSVTDDQNRRFYGIYRNALVNEFSNRGPVDKNRISRSRERLHVVETGVNWPTQFGDITLETRFYSDRPNTPGRKASQAQLEFRWVSSF
jgi:hypothetical protein